MKKFFLGMALLLVLFAGCVKEDAQPVVPPAGGNLDENGSDTNEATNPFGEGISELEQCRLLPTANERDECIQALAISELDTSTCNELEKYSVDFCVKEIAVASENPSECVMIGTDFLKDECFYNLALSLSQKDLCENIASESKSKECTKTLLVESGEVSCEQEETQVEKDACFVAAAAAESNPFLCEFVSTIQTSGNFLRDSCITGSLESYNIPDACEIYLNQELKDNCFLETAKELLDESLCENITSQDGIDQCIDSVAREKLDSTVCEKISDEDLAEECTNFIVETNPSPEICDKATTYAAKDQCNYDAGIELLNAGYCSKISGGDLKSSCFFQVAVASLDSGLCGKIAPTEYDLKDDCYSSISFDLLDETICENVHFGDNYISCFSLIAVQTNRLEVCDSMERFTLLNLGYDPVFACYRDYAIEKGLPEICERITPTVPHQECIDGT